MATLICIGIAPSIARLTTINYAFLGPPIIVLIVFTAFQATVSWGDIWALAACSVLGILMKRFEWPRPALVIGFVLASGFEAAIYRTVQIYGFDFLWRPQSQLLILLILVSLYFGYRAMRKTSRLARESAKPAVRSRIPQIAFTAAILASIAYALVSALDFRYLSGLFPIWVAGVTGILLLVVAAEQKFRGREHPVLSDARQAELVRGEELPSSNIYLASFALLLLLIWLLGYPIGAAVFIVGFLSFAVPGNMARNLLIGLAAMTLLTMLAYWLHLTYPPGLLTTYLDLPWWLG